MEIAYILNSILMPVAVSLGVGCSTVAIAQFFVAIGDGEIDPKERQMLGMVYLLLRVAMGAILFTLLVQFGIIYYLVQTWEFISEFFLSVWTVVAVLFLNAIGMTWRWIPSKIGPGIQAGSWYTLGVLMALISIGLTSFSYLQFILCYAGVLLLVVALVNVIMVRLKR